MKPNYLLIILAIIAPQMAGALQQAERGAVQGTVLDENGRPAAHVRVYPLAERSAYMGIVPSAISDDTGNFFLRGLLPGETRLFPVFTEAGYPDGRSGIFTGDPSLYQIVNVEPGRTITGVILKLPRKGAVFRAHIIDILTGKHVLSSRIRIIRADVPDVFYESGPDLHGQFQIILVPDVPFRIEIRAENYKEWHYARLDDRGIENFNLVLKSEAIEEVTVKLQPLPRP